MSTEHSETTQPWRMSGLRDTSAKKYAKQFRGGRRFGSIREYAEADYAQGWDDAVSHIPAPTPEQVAILEDVIRAEEMKRSVIALNWKPGIEPHEQRIAALRSLLATMKGGNE